MSWNLKHIDPSDIESHPVNTHIYGDTPDPEFVSLIKRDGVQQPLHAVNHGGRMRCLSGHRRKQAACSAKLATVPVLVFEGVMSDAEQVVWLCNLNAQREKTLEQKTREFAARAEAESSLAAERQEAAQVKTGDKLRNGVGNVAHTKKQGENAQSGRAKDIAAEAVGVSRRTAETASKALAVADKLKADGKAKEAAEIVETLNTKGAAPALSKAEQVQQQAKPEPKATDPAGLEILPGHEDVFCVVTHFRRAMSLVTQAVSAVAEQTGTHDGARVIDLHDVKSFAEDLRNLIKEATPHTRCPNCKPGKGNLQCTTCKGRSWICWSEWRTLGGPQKEALGLK